MTVGSASSLSSATSSVFSNTLATTPLSASDYNMNNLTPLTHTESSPPGKMLSPRSHKRSYEQMQNGATNSPYHHHTHHTHLAPPGSTSRAVSETITPVQTPPDASLQARPGPGEVTAVKILYDPEQDKSLDAKQRRHMKPTYRTLTAEVRSTSMQVVVADTRR
jgi:histone-lysine N-methyltransferase SETD1